MTVQRAAAGMHSPSVDRQRSRLRAGACGLGTALLVASLCGFGRGLALAQAGADDGRWLVLPSVVASQGEPKHPARLAAQALAEELRGHRSRAFSPEEGKGQFEQRGSTEPMTASAADIDELAKDAQRAPHHVA